MSDLGPIRFDAALPPVIATIGVHGSASTWVFNIVRELLISALGEDKVLAGFAGGLRGLPAESELHGRHFLLKSHNGSVELDEWLTDHRAALFLSVRDPRDAALSLARRFNRALPDAIRIIAQDFVRIIRLEANGHRLLRYEDRFFEREDTVLDIAKALALRPRRQDLESIFGRYTRESMLALAASLPYRKSDDGEGSDTADLADPITYIHKTHIGDGRSGKWRSLPISERKDLERLLRPIVDHFGYPES